MTAALLTSLALALTWTPGPELRAAAASRVREPRERRPRQRRRPRADARARRASHGFSSGRSAKPLWAGGICLLLVIGTWGGYQMLGTNLLPDMDEGGFILDYIMPAGSSLAETNRVLDHVDAHSALHSRSRKHLAPHRPAVGPGRRDRGQHRRLHGEAQSEAQPLASGM